MNPKLNSYLFDETTTIEELERSIPIIQKEIDKRKAKELDEVRLQFREMAKNLGVPLEILLEEPTTKKPTKKVEPRYRSKVNPENTWSGRGKKPRWLVEELENGGDLADFLI